MSEFSIRTENLMREFGSRIALDGVSLSVPSGQILALAGPNGAGKTTLLKIFAGLIQPTGGTATLCGESCFPTPSNLARQFRCVLDPFEPPGNETIHRMIELSAGASPSFDSNRAIQLCRERGIEPRRRWAALSKGQKRWVLAVLALVARPKVLLLDEPADGLDPSARQALYDMLREDANQHGTTMVIASHVLADIERIADEVAIMDRGKLKLHACLEDLRDEVREIEVNGDAFPVDSLPAGAVLLGSRSIDPVTIGWVRFADRSDTARLVPGEIRRRSVPLEPMYLAITDHAWQPDPSGSEEPAHV